MPGCSPSRFEGHCSSLQSCLEVSPCYPGALCSNLETLFVQKSIESAIWQRLWGFFAVPRDCAGSSSAGLAKQLWDSLYSVLPAVSARVSGH